MALYLRLVRCQHRRQLRADWLRTGSRGASSSLGNREPSPPDDRHLHGKRTHAAWAWETRRLAFTLQAQQRKHALGKFSRYSFHWNISAVQRLFAFCLPNIQRRKKETPRPHLCTDRLTKVGRATFPAETLRRRQTRHSRKSMPMKCNHMDRPIKTKEISFKFTSASSNISMKIPRKSN